MARWTQSSRISTDASGVKTPDERDLFVGALRCAQDKLKLRPPEDLDSLSEPLWRYVSALGGALDLDCCAVNQDFGDALHQLV
jgi:hypothetical protein